MFRVSTLLALVLGLTVAVAGLTWCQAGVPAPQDDGKEKTPAELLVGTWTKTGTDHFKLAWWHSVRLHFNADRTWSATSNDEWRLFRTEQNHGSYELVGNELRLTGPEVVDDPERVAAGIAPDVPLRQRTRAGEVVVLTRDELTIQTPRGGGDPPRRQHYRRVR